MRPRCRVACFGEHGVPVGLDYAGHPALGAAQDPVALVARALVGHSPGAHTGHIAAGLGLGQTESRSQFSAGDPGQIALLLFVVASDQDRARGQAGQQQHQGRRVRVLGHLFDGDGQAQDAGTGAAELCRQAQAEEVGIAEGIEDVLWVLP